jgi:hypothetical protein
MCRNTLARLVGAFEQVTVRAARRVREMFSAIGVTREAHGARSSGRVSVASVAAHAVLVLGLSVQPGQRGAGVAARARGHRREPAWPVRSVARRTPGRELAVGRSGFGRVACRARDARSRAGMRLMAIRTDLVANRRRSELLHVACFALDGDAARVRFMATRAPLMPGSGVTARVSVARDARRAHDAARLVGQPLMAGLARGVTHARRRQRHFLLMAACTHGVLLQRDREMVSRVTALARDARVKVVISRCDAMTTAASTRYGTRLVVRRVWLMARHAGPVGDAFGVIGVDVRVALHAGGARVAANVVRGVAARTTGMLRDAGRGKHHDVRVARATIDRFAGLERVRLMTRDALAVPTGKQRRGRHDRLGRAVTLGARGERVGGGRVLMRVASRAHAVRRFAERRVRRVNVVMAAGAVRGGGLLILVRVVAVQARGGSVHRHRRGFTLHLVMAARAVFGAIRLEHASGVERASVERAALAVFAGKGVTIHAIGVHTGPKALLGQPRRMCDAGASGMAHRTTHRRHRADRRRVQLVAAAARDVLTDHVHLVAGHAAIRAPAQLHVQPFAGRCARALRRTRSGTSTHNGEQEQAAQRQNGEPNGVLHDRAHTMHFKPRRRAWRFSESSNSQTVPWHTNIESLHHSCSRRAGASLHLQWLDHQNMQFDFATRAAQTRHHSVVRA